MLAGSVVSKEISLGLRRFQLTGAKRSPGSGTPPRNDKAEESPIARTARFRRPQVDRAREWEGRANLCDDGCGDEGEDASD